MDTVTGPVTPNYPLGKVFTAGWQTQTAKALGRGGGYLIYGDSTFAGKGDNWNNSVVNWLRDYLTSTYDNPGYESGWGRVHAADSSGGSTGSPSWVDKNTFTGTPASALTVNNLNIRSNGANSQCRIVVPPTITGPTGKVYKNKKIELVISAYGESTAPSITVDIYPVSGPITAGTGYITAGTAGSISLNGITGITRTITPGNITNGAEYDCGVENITFDGTTTYICYQVTTSSDCEVAGWNLFNNDWGVEDKSNPFQDFAISGAQLAVNRSTQTSGSEDYTASNFAGHCAMFRSQVLDNGWAGIANANGVNAGPVQRIKLMILARAINDQLLNTNSPSTYGGYLMDTVDAILQASPGTQIILVQMYCIKGAGGSTWRTGYNNGGGGNQLSTAITWTAYNAAIYAIQAKWPNNVAVVSIDRLLGEDTYDNTITARGWNQADAIHWKGGGPQWCAQQIMSIMPAKTTVGLASGLGSGTWANALHAVRFDKYKTITDYGSAGGTWTRDVNGSFFQYWARPSGDGLSVVFKCPSQLAVGHYVYSLTPNPPTGDFTILVRMYVNATPVAGKQYINDIVGNEGGTGSNHGVRLGADGTLAHALRFMHLNGSTYANTDAVVGQWNTFVVQNSGGTLSYRVNGSAAGTASFTPPTAQASAWWAGGFAAPARPIEPGSGLSHWVLMPSAISLADIQAWEANPDIAFTLT